ncbi:MAG: phosphoadenylyl-sulfate reductase [Candidatus Omnitrophica bacterium]|nr:phosphoadenylyl-sulfate reductase [Candidatus Omnitrophota bacterium]
MDVASVNQTFEKKSPQELLRWALEEFGDKIALASSFGVEDVALIDMMMKINRKARVFTLDTGRLDEETYEVMDRIRDRYGLSIESYFPDLQKVEALERTKGFYSFRKSVENRKECCGIRKVEPLGRALSTLKAWLTGLRRAQAVTRTDIAKVEVDSAHHNIIKINPLADWSEKQVWDYVKQNQVPYNKLHDQGYPSIGCSPCTRAIKPGEDIRAGRWWWENPEQKECGLHVHKAEEKGKER